MKKIIILIAAFLMALTSEDALYAQSYQTECISTELDGSQTLRVQGKGRNRRDAIEQAKKNAVYEVLFKGVLKGNSGYDLRPLVTTVNARERYREYFDIFFMDGGEYLKYVSMADRRLNSTTKEKSSTQVSCVVTVRVLCPELRSRLITDGIIKVN